jgi:S-adenosyl methyltransferase
MNGVLKVAPFAADMATENRSFLIRACRFLAARARITQFLDCGSGLPTAENTHQVAQRVTMDARVVYIDNDPVVLAHGRALLEQNDRRTFVSADIFQPPDIMENEEIRTHLDLSRPIGLLHARTLHHHTGEKAGPMRIMR